MLFSHIPCLNNPLTAQGLVDDLPQIFVLLQQPEVTALAAAPNKFEEEVWWFRQFNVQNKLPNWYAAVTKLLPSSAYNYESVDNYREIILSIRHHFGA
jgi:hypothetical protein